MYKDTNACPSLSDYGHRTWVNPCMCHVWQLGHTCRQRNMSTTSLSVTITRIRLLQTAPTIASRSLRTESCQVVKPPVTIKLKSWQFSTFSSTHHSYCLTLLPMNIHRNLTDVMQITQNWDTDRVQPKNYWHVLHFVVFCLSSALVDFTNITQGLT